MNPGKFVTSFICLLEGVVAVWLDIKPFECVDRVRNRMNHPTLPPERAERAVSSFAKKLEPPTVAEGFETVFRVASNAEADALLIAFGASNAVAQIS